MSSKKLNTAAIVNELEGSSLYFNPPFSATAPRIPSKERMADYPDPVWTRLKEPVKGDNLTPHASMHASPPGSTHTIPPERMQESSQNDLIKAIRNTVKQVGKEELYVRLTPDEKKDLRKIVYRFNEIYCGVGRKTSDNEVSRIALRFLLEDYHSNGERSILAITQAALNA